MEREFQSMYIAGDGSVRYYSPAFKPEDSSSGSISNTAGFRSLVSLNQEKPLLSSLDHPLYSSASLPQMVMHGDFPANIHGNQEATTRKLESTDFIRMEPERKLKMPKHEYFPPEPFNFIVPNSSFPTSEHAIDPSSCSNQLPDLRSLEHMNNYDLAVAEPSSSRRRGKSPSSPSTAALTTHIPYVLESIFRNFEFASYSSPPENAPPKRNNRPSELARIRRNTLSEKTRCLQKLLPWDRKMDTATMYEEAHKYIKFLQAQVSILQCMPRDTNSGFSLRPNPSAMDFYGGLGRLNRQQLLQVLINSPVAQTVLCSKGFCIYSMEQLLVLKKIAEAKVSMFNPNPSTFL